MRVAIISEVFLPKIDGVVNRTLNLIQQLIEFGDNVLVICPQAKGCNQCPVPVVGVPSFSFRPYPEYRIGMPKRREVEAIKRFAPEVIHYVNPFAFGFRCHDVLRRAGVRTPSVFSFHTLYGEFVKRYKGLQPLSNLLWWLMREYHNRADVNLTVSSVMQQELVQRGFQRVELWPPAVDTDLFHRGRKSPAMRARLSDGQPDRPLLLTVSRLAPEKNVGFLANVLEQFPDARLAVVGDGPQRAELERRFNGNACFVGYLKGQELAEAYASADVFVYASETETMGNVVLEAMAAGCPVVAPRAGGIPSLLAHGDTGFLYRAGDLVDAVALIRALLADQRLHSRVAQAARREVEGRNWEQSVARVRQVYGEAIREEARRPILRWNWRERLPQMTTFGLVSAFRYASDWGWPKRRRPRRVAATMPRLLSAPSSSDRKPDNSAGTAPRGTAAAGTEPSPWCTSR
jgi:glycosyltransferase involved in cell wall biosynthesis